MRHAARLALNADCRMRHGAVLVRGGRLLGVGWNRSRTGNRWVTHQPRETCSEHAEVAAIRGRDAVGATVFVVRIRADGQYAESRPCPACWSALEAAGVRRVVHS